MKRSDILLRQRCDFLSLASLVALLLHILAPAAGACAGDCDKTGEVTTADVLKSVRIALGVAPMADCSSLDRNANTAMDIDEVLFAVKESIGGCMREPVFPANYRDSFIEVRNCRFSTEHDFTYIRVLANPIAAQPYVNDANPLPTGSIVVKEEFNNPGCQGGHLVRWRAMRKEEPGFDPVDGDWHWQWVERDRSVKFDDKTTCISCHVRTACLVRDHMCTESGGPPRGTLQLVLSRLPAALLSIAGTSPSDVYTVGADSGDGFGPFVLHYDGTRWRRLNSGVTGAMLWWVSVPPIDGSFYLAGEKGVILRYDPTQATFERQATPGSETLYGIWGTSRNNIYAVGGDPANEDQGGVVWHFDGRTWRVDDEVAKVVPDGLPTLFKVWGRGEHDVYIVGRRGVVLHSDGIHWSPVESNSLRPLFTVHGNDTQTVAVGGFSNGVILELADGVFADQAVLGTPQMNGVFIPPDGRGVAVGIAGALALRTATGWEVQDTGLNILQDFHATWVDPEGGIWAVGGNLTTNSNGVLAYGGARTIGSQIVPLVPCPPATPGGPMTVSYANDIAPLFSAAGCASLSCHGGPFPSSLYDMRNYETTFGPGVEAKSLKVCDIAPGNPDASFLLEKLDPSPRVGAQMPSAPRLPLTSEQINLIRTWILEGAQDDSPPTPTPTGAPSQQATPTRTRTPTSPAPTTPTITTTPNATETAAACQVPGVICTVAGTGLSQFDGDGRPALQTSLYFPLGVTFDPVGRALIVDWNNLRIRRINADGTIETIMGKDYEDFPTDGALAVDTPLHHASDIKFDNGGNLYVAGDHVPVVFRVGTDNRVFTVAGTTDSGNDGDDGPARQAKLTSPFGVLPTADGGFYIGDVDAHVVRYVDPAGTIHTVAGTGVRGYSADGGPGRTVPLNGPTRLQQDGDGNLYFCDTNNHVVNRLDRGGTLTTVAGMGTPGYSGDDDLATRAQLNTPYDLRLAPNGDLYVADTGNSVIRRIDRNGTITTVVGTVAGFAGDGGDARACRLNRPSGVAFAADGSMWISDTFNQRVRRVAGFLSLPN